MSKETRETIKEETNKFMQKVYNKLTKTQAGVLSIVFTALVLILFLCTYTGRHIIVFVAYVAFIAAVLYCGYRLFKHTTVRAKGVPKPKKQVEDEPDDIEFNDVEGEDPFVNDGSEEEVPTEEFGEDVGESGAEEPEPGTEEPESDTEEPESEPETKT